MKNKTFALTMLLIVMIIGILGYYLYSVSNDKPISISVKNVVSKVKNTTTNETKNTTKNTTSKNTTTEVEETNLENVNNYNNFFNIDKLINDYYDAATSKDGEALLNIIDPSYLKAHTITSKNINKYYLTDFDDITYFSKEMYYKEKGDISYYFVNGETQNYKFDTEEMTEGKNVYFMICIDTYNSTYTVYPLSSNISSIYSYGKSYNMANNKTIEDNENNTYYENEYSDLVISTYYINYYRTLMFMNTEKAYNMLYNKTTYDDLEAFNNDLENLYTNVLGGKILGYNVTGENGSRTYIINFTDNKTVTIKEESINNFTLSF